MTGTLPAGTALVLWVWSLKLSSTLETLTTAGAVHAKTTKTRLRRMSHMSLASYSLTG